MEEFGSFECVLGWNACSCIEWGWMEWLDEVNGGWGCIYNHQPLPSCCPLFANLGWFTLLARMVHHCTSTIEIATISNNGYKCIKCVIRCQIKQSQAVQPCTADGPRGCYNSFLLNLAPLGFSGFQWADDPRLRPDGPSLVPDGVLLSFEQSVVEMWVLHSSCPRLTKVSQTVCRKGPDGPCTGEIYKSFSCLE
jgi:hypothetical protein